MEYRTGLPERPARIAALPLDDRGYPVPWFVAWIDGKPDFRVIGPGKIAEAWNKRRCWLCGQQLGRYVAFVIGPMCAVNRITSEPPCHRECAFYAAEACPFLVMPSAKRRDAGLPADAQDAAGVGLKRNPGMALVWIADTKGPNRPRPWKVENGTLFRVGDVPDALHWFTEGRFATPDEVAAALERGCPAVRQLAEDQGPDAIAAFDQQLADAQRIIATHTIWAAA